MFNNYLKIAIRNILKYKGYSLIYIIGLAIGMACCILIFLFINNEISYDRFHTNADRIFRVINEKNSNDKIFRSAIGPMPLAPALLNEFPEIIHATRLFNPDNPVPLIQYENNRF